MTNSQKKHILMAASENGALGGGKAGGVGDVIAHLPCALADLGMKISIITPSYGFLHERNKILGRQLIEFPFCGSVEQAVLYKVKAKKPKKNVSHFVLENIWIRGDPIYTHDEQNRPFAADASKFAMFCSAVARIVTAKTGLIKGVDIIHGHDWHAGTLFLLRAMHPDFAALKKMKSVFTIHNLALQGTRPMQGDESSLLSWFPELGEDREIQRRLFAEAADHRYDMPCYTPLTSGIQYADAVNTVSPSYAEEILIPSDHERGYYGGEGLEVFLREAMDKGRLYGILNAINYSDKAGFSRWPFSKLRKRIEVILADPAISNSAKNALELRSVSLERVRKWKGRRVKFVATFVGRIVDQKLRLFLDEDRNGISGLESILKILDEHQGILIILGVGVRQLEEKLHQVMRRFDNFLFVRDYSENIAERLYSSGHIFMMPSLFEPCGISQLYSMRSGQPPLAHNIGGLKDTVRDGVDGFVFDGSSIEEKIEDMTVRFREAVGLFFADKEAWMQISYTASQVRFLWADTAAKYIQDLYSIK